jgi:hypothetical protein
VCRKFIDGFGLAVLATEVRERFEDCDHFEKETEETVSEGLPKWMQELREELRKPCNCEECKPEAVDPEAQPNDGEPS